MVKVNVQEQDTYLKELRANFELTLQTLRDENLLALEKGKINSLTTILIE